MRLCSLFLRRLWNFEQQHAGIWPGREGGFGPSRKLKKCGLDRRNLFLTETPPLSLSRGGVLHTQSGREATDTFPGPDQKHLRGKKPSKSKGKEGSEDLSFYKLAPGPHQELLTPCAQVK